MSSTVQEPHGAVRVPPPSDPGRAVHLRFDRLARLYGEPGVHRLAAARVLVLGVGGVGSFAAEALVRSAVGHVMLVDFDEVCVTNTNRQLQAVQGAVGRSKAELLRDRLRLVNPDAAIEAARRRYDPAHADDVLSAPWPGPTTSYDFVVDCIDDLPAKAHLIATCRARDVPIVSAMGAGGKTDPTRVRIADLGRTFVCPLAHQLRRTLRREHGFPGGRRLMGVTAVYSDEPRHWPQPVAGYPASTADCDCPRSDPVQGCQTRRHIDGTAAFVTGAFGLACASHVVNALAGGPRPEPMPGGAELGDDES